MGGGPGATFGVSHQNFKVIENNTRTPWILDPALRWNMFHCLGLCMSLFFNGYDGSLLNGLQSLPRWQEFFGQPSANTIGLMASAGFLPGIVAGFTADYFGFYFGRRATVWLGSAIATAGALVMAWLVIPQCFVEVVGGFYTCIYYIAAITSTSVCLGTLSYKTDLQWRLPCYLQMMGPILTILMTATAPESPRWLTKKGRTEEARNVLVKYHANGRQDDPLVEYEWREIQEALRNEESNDQTKYTDFIHGSGNRRRLLILLIVSVGTNWVGNGIISYYLSPILRTLGITSSTTQLQIIIGMNVWNFIISTFAAVFADEIGRRPLWLMSTAGMLVNLIIVMALSGSYAKSQHAAVGTAVIPFLFLFFGSYDLAWTPLAYAYPIEILPFSMRTKGQALFVAVQTGAVAANTWVNPVALAAIQWKYYAMYIGILTFLCLIIYFRFPETKNLTIEEIAVVFDGDKALGILRASQGENPASQSAEVESGTSDEAKTSVYHVEVNKQ